MSQPINMLTSLTNPIQARGFSLIEVLVTIVILLIGLLGLAGLQSRAFTTQLESYQRSQAIILIQDLVDRIDANRKNAAEYLTADPTLGGAGVGVAIACPGGTVAQQDLCRWHNALLGSAEGDVAGTMIGARGCVIEEVAPATGTPATYQVIVSWQGLNNSSPPDKRNAFSPGKCGLGMYKDRSGAVNEALHRAISLPVAIADLKAAPAP